MGKYPAVGNNLDNLFRNTLNGNFDNIGVDVTNLQTQINTLVINGDSSPEAAQAAIDAKGVNKGTLKQRLDDDYNQLIQMFKDRSVSVMDFGAKGNGTTDDTAAFNNAINSLSSAGGIVFVPYGHTYMIQGWISGSVNDFPTGGVKLKSNIVMMGIGATLKVISNSKDHYACINITGCNNVKIAGLTLIGERSTHTNSPTYSDYGDQWGYGVAVIGSSDIIIEDVVAKDFTGDGFYIGADSTGLLSANVTLRDCLAHNNRRNGMSITGLYTGLVEGCTFRNTNGWLPEAGVDVEPNPGRAVEDVTFVGNKFLSNNSYGLLFGSINASTKSGSNCAIIGNIARYNKSTGIYINKGYDNTIIGNQSHENDENGIALYEAHYNVLANNKASLNKMHGFLIGYAEHNEITGNHSKSNGQAQDQTYDQFTLFSAHHNNIQSNTARHEFLTIKARYGMYLTSDCDSNLVSNNDFAASGFFYGLNNAATTQTVKGAGNRGNDYMSWSTGDYI